MTSSWIQDVRDADFKEKVLSRSGKIPVLVDFWAPWCAPCRILGPILEKVVDARQGKIELARLNTDENPITSSRYRIQGIPAVLAFVDGEIADAFSGALPERQIAEFIDRIIPSPADLFAKKALTIERNPDEALKLYEEALRSEPQHAASLIGRFRFLVALDRLEEAEKSFSQLPPTLQYEEEVVKIKTALDLARIRKSGPALDQLKDRVEKEPENHEARWEYAQRLAAEMNYAESLDHLFLIVKKDRKFKDDGARKAALQLFELMGEDNPLTRDYREKLAQLLF